MDDQSGWKPWRRIFRIRLRTLIILVLSVGGGLGWLIHEARVQRDAVATITRNGGSCAYSWQWSYKQPYPSRPKPPWPEWARRALGPDFLESVVVGPPDGGAVR